jgi:hypothetical protein
MKHLCRGLSLLALGPGLLAAAQEITVNNHGLPHPPPGFITGTATEALIGRFDADTVPDTVLLQDGLLYLVHSPDRIYTYEQLGGPFTSITKVPLETTIPRDGVIASYASGVRLLTCDDEGDWTIAPLTGVSGWGGAKQLQTVEHAGAETMVCGVAASETAILYAQWNGSGLVLPGSRGTTTTIKAMAGLHWNSDNTLDFAFHDGDSLNLIVGPGPIMNALQSATPSPHLLRLPIPGYDDGLLLVAGNPGAQTLLSLARELGPTNNVAVMQSIPCAPNTVERLTLANFDAHTHTDLVLSVSRPEGRFARVLYGFGPGVFNYLGLVGNPYDPQAILSGVEFGLADIWSTTCGYSPAIAGGDLDGDGDGDLVYAGSSFCTPQVRVYLGNGVYEDWAPVESELWNHVKPWLGLAQFECEPDRFEFFPWQAPNQGPAVEATHIRFRAFSAGEGVLDDLLVPIGFFSYPLPAGHEPDELYFEFSYVRAEGYPPVVQPYPSGVQRSFPAWVGSWSTNKQPVDGVPNPTGGLDRPPTPSGPPITHNP